MKKKHILLAAAYLLILAGACFAWEGRVVGVSDGDTLKILHDGRQERVRLWGCDAPESHQDFGQVAKKFTSSLVFGKTVSVDVMDTDRYGRTVAVVSVDGKCLNEALVASGMSWVYRTYCRKPQCAAWIELEKNARASGIGLWAGKNPTPPWDFRRQQREH